jgi:hypothetical protein
MIKKIILLSYRIKGSTHPITGGVLRNFNIQNINGSIIYFKRFINTNIEKFPAKDPKKENQDDLSNTKFKEDFEDEKNVTRIFEIKNKKASERTKQEILFVINYYRWLKKDI